MSQWISVEGQLPLFEGVVLTYAKPYVRTAEILYFEKNIPQWIDGGVVFDGVTHWMPLPEPPTQKS